MDDTGDAEAADAALWMAGGPEPFLERLQHAMRHEPLASIALLHAHQATAARAWMWGRAAGIAAGSGLTATAASIELLADAYGVEIPPGSRLPGDVEQAVDRAITELDLRQQRDRDDPDTHPSAETPSGSS